MFVLFFGLLRIYQGISEATRSLFSQLDSQNANLTILGTLYLWESTYRVKNWDSKETVSVKLHLNGTLYCKPTCTVVEIFLVYVAANWVYHLIKYMLLNYSHKLIIVIKFMKNYLLCFWSVSKETNWEARSTEIKGIHLLNMRLCFSNVLITTIFLVIATFVISPITL